MPETQKLFFDDGLLRLDINGNGLLVFNPTDFNLFQRFFALREELPQLEQKYKDTVEAITDDMDEDQALALTGQELDRAEEIDAEVKAKLSAVFGGGADFDQLLGGVNVMAWAHNGERVITNLLNALRPYIEEGVEKHTRGAVDAAKLNREQRRAAQRRAAKPK